MLFYVDFCNELGDTRSEDEMRAAGSIHNVRELTDKELADTEYFEEHRPRDTYSFADALADMSLNLKVPMFFATTGY